MTSGRNVSGVPCNAGEETLWVYSQPLLDFSMVIIAMSIRLESVPRQLFDRISQFEMEWVVRRPSGGIIEGFVEKFWLQVPRPQALVQPFWARSVSTQ